jgi:hypothetical protein
VQQPMNVVVLLPVFRGVAVLGRLGLVTLLFVPALFLAWCWAMLRDGTATVPLRSFVLLTLAIAISVWSVVAGAPYALEYQGEDYLKGVRLISVLWWFGLSALAFLAKCRPNALLNHMFHFALFAWLAWYALPYMGELP